MIKKLLVLITASLILLPITLSYELNDFPNPFVSEGKYNSFVVVGDKAYAEDIIALGDIVQILSKFDLTEPCRGWVECERRISSSPSKLAEEIRDLNNNFISIGGPCANKITAQIMDLPTTWPECAKGFENGIGRLIIYKKWNKTQLIVAGFSAKDTKKAAEVLANYQQYNLSGKELIIPDYKNIEIIPVIRSCPNRTHIDCMPNVAPENAYYCIPINRERIQKNCNVEFLD